MIGYSDCTHKPESKDHYKTNGHPCIYAYIMKLNSLCHHLAFYGHVNSLSLRESIIVWPMGEDLNLTSVLETVFGKEIVKLVWGK